MYNEVLTFATALAIGMLSTRGHMSNEISQAQKDQYHIFAFICGNGKLDLKEKSRVRVTKD